MATQGPGLLSAFDPPAHLTDLTDSNRPGWSAIVSDMCDGGRAGRTDHTNDAPRPQFFNATKEPVGEDLVFKEIKWQAFPKRVITQSGGDDETRWRLADSDRNVQDEYCEWSVTRDPTGKITSVIFTSEAPEYWSYLGEVQKDTVVQLYKEHINFTVKESDLFDASGDYVPVNKWNRDTVNGAMHLTMRANTLGAEVELGAAATLPRKVHGDLMTDQQDLINCAKYGNPGRFSDPHIGSEVNTLARAGWSVTISNPVALYMDSFEPVGFNMPPGATVGAAECWTWTRSNGDLHVAGKFEAPPGSNWVVGDITIDGKGPLRYGSMLADYITIKLTGLACNNAPSNIQPVNGCVRPKPSGLVTLAQPAAKVAKVVAPALFSALSSSDDGGVTTSTGGSSAIPAGRASPEDAAASKHASAAVQANQEVLRLIVGIDDKVQAMDPSQVASLLQDPFARLVLLNTPPAQRQQAMDGLMDAVKRGSDADKQKKFNFASYLVGDGGKIPFSKFPKLDRSFRFVWTREMKSNAALDVSDLPADIVVVAGTDNTSITRFLQVASWDRVNGVWNYYARHDPQETADMGGTPPAPGVGQWVWAGSSPFAFDPRSRGKGPFDGHVNGSLVMKELRFPWNNWHSSHTNIDSAIGPDDPLRSNPLFKDKNLADRLQTLVVENGIIAWTKSRLAKAFERDGTIKQTPKYLLQHIFKSSTVNLITSPIRSKQDPEIGDIQPIALPLTFFANTRVLSDPLVLGDLGAAATGLTLAVPYTEVYQPTIEKYGFQLVGTSPDGKITIPGDTFNAFMVPEPATEDNQVVLALLEGKHLSRRFVVCALMVDFMNPVYSAMRLSLLRFVPDAGNITTLEGIVVAAILKEAAAGDAAAQEFKSWWDLPEDKLVDEARTAVISYLGKANTNCATMAGFDQYIRLSEYRRRQYGNFNEELNEFSLTLPQTKIPTNAEPLTMTRDATVTLAPQNKAEAMLKAALTKNVTKNACTPLAKTKGCPFSK